MSSKKENILNMLNLALSRTPSNIIHLLNDSGKKIKKGQVWSLKTNNFLCLVSTPPRNDVLDVIPLFRWTENAGPEDLFLPPSFLGTEMLASFELRFSLPSACLTVCRGILPVNDIKFIDGAQKENETGSKKDTKYAWGWNYLDENDIRYKFHEDYINEIQILQNSIWERIKTIPSASYTNTNNNPFVIQFPEFQEEYKLAASPSKKSPLKKVMHSPKIPKYNFCFTEERDTHYIHLNILKKHAPSTELDGSKVCDASGRKIAVINNSKARLTKECIRHGIIINDINGAPIKLKP
jgi:hypothetical protein